MQKKQTRFPYRLYLLIALLCCFTGMKSWAGASYTAVKSGSWNDPKTWTNAPNPPATAYPRVGDVATINGFSISISGPEECQSITIDNGTSLGKLTIGTNGTLNVSNSITLQSTGNNNLTSTLDIGSGIVNAGTISLKGGNGQRKAAILISSGELKVIGNVDIIPGANPNASIGITGAGTLKIAGILDFDGIFSGGTSSTVVFNGGVAQTIPAYAYANITITNPSGVKPATNIVAATTANTISVTGKISVQNGGVFNNDGKTITGASGRILEVMNGGKFITSTAAPFPSDYTLSINPVGDPYATIQFAGAASQTIPAGAYGKIEIIGSDKALAGNVTTKQLDLTGGSLVLSNSSIIMQQPASIIGANAIHYIKQTGTGKLIIEGIIGGSASEVTFPVGTVNAYTPAYIKNTGDIGGSGDYSVLVTNGISGTSGQAVSYLVAKRTWNVERVTGTGSPNITLRLQWDPADEGTDFVRTNVGIAHFEGGTWQQPPAGSFTDGSSTYSASLANITSFSPFGVVNPNNPLPVELISFKASRKNNSAYLQWATATEKDNQGFYVQSSTDGRHFEDLGFIASRNPNSASLQQYDFLTKNDLQAGLHYFRLKQTDFNGTVSYSGIKVVDFGKQDKPMIYPNPFSKQIYCSIEAGSNDELSYQIIDLTGKTVCQGNQKLERGTNSLQINVTENLEAGIYLLRTQTSNGTTSTRLIKQ